MTVELRVDEAGLEAFCRTLVNRSRDLAKTQDSLATLEAFIAVFGKAHHGSGDYRSIETVIRLFAEQSRQQLLEQRAEELCKALKHCDRSRVTAVHAPLSRNGFQQILQSVIPRLTSRELDSIRNWAFDWSRKAKQKAESASGYPDALNFSGAGIDVMEYQAMLDVSRCLKGDGAS